MFDLSSITTEAHRVARIYRGSVPYAQALAWGYAQAWQQVRTLSATTEREATLSPDARARRDEALTIQCSTDGALSPASISRLTELSRAA